MEDEKINKAQVSEVENNDKKEENKKNRFSEFYIEAVLFLVLGILVGFAIKTEAVKKITMGFSDYKMNVLEKGYDINDLEKKETQKRIEKMEQMKQSDGTQQEDISQENLGGSCQ